jgi:hypothetical protein
MFVQLRRPTPYQILMLLLCPLILFVRRPDVLNVHQLTLAVSTALPLLSNLETDLVAGHTVVHHAPLFIF